MNSPLTLLLGVHVHQPVGNFPAVIAEAHEKSYQPFLRTLYRYPEFRFAVHFSGWLLEELEREYPADMDLVRVMVARGQIELVGGGMAEPVLAAIPHRDRCGQLDALSAHLARHYGVSPTGAWLTERVWEAAIVPALATSKIGYVTVDDYHFLCTGLPATALDGHYTTEEGGHTVDLFPIAEGLRYRLPFAPALDAVAYLEELAARGDRAAIYFDDIEKFGIWPETYDWVYTRGWLTQFIEGVLASPTLITSTYADFRDTHRTRGVVYLPTTSYSEMNEWTLPADAAANYAGLVQRARDENNLARDRPFLRGGIWRNFLTRYPEANWMHKRMLDVSARLAAAPAHPRGAVLRGALYRAQANDAYWHGLFGGIYLPHLRRAIWRNLLEVEAALPATIESAPRDLDLDGSDEVILRSAEVLAAIRVDGLGALHEFSSYRELHNFGDTLRRTVEHYHALITKSETPGVATESNSTGIASPHERVAYKTPLDPRTLIPDRHGRGIFIDSVGHAAEACVISDYQLLSSSAGAASFATSLSEDRGELMKEILLAGATLTVNYHCKAPRATPLASVLHLALPSCDGFGGRYRLSDQSIPCGFGQQLHVAALREIWLEDAELGARLHLHTSQAVEFSAEPYHTASQSEAGFEQIMQAARLELRWVATEQPLSLALTIEAVGEG